MDREIKKEAMKNYFRYFRIWFIITGIIVFFTVFVAAIMLFGSNSVRQNNFADKERVFDYADVLTDSEEQNLRKYIAECEKKGHFDIVLITINRPVEYEYPSWDYAMMNIADDAYDNGMYGWNRKYGDGALLLDNWYEDENGSQKGSWLSTSGKMEENIGSWEESLVFREMDAYIDSNPYMAYRAAIGKLTEFSKHGAGYENFGSYYLGSFVISLFVAISYGVVCMNQSKPKDTTTARTYVENGKPDIRSHADTFIRKSLTSHKIQSSSGGGGGGGGRSGGGSYGHHTSSGGHSHGGGGHRR